MIYVLSDNPQLLRAFQRPDLLPEFRKISLFEFQKMKHDQFDKVKDLIFIDLNLYVAHKDVFANLPDARIYLLNRIKRQMTLIPLKDLAQLSSEDFWEWLTINQLKNEERAEIPFIVRDKRMESVLQYSLKVAGINAPVLITGETGTGKEFIARYIYKNSDRSDKPFVTVNCAAIPSTLIETELFGYKKGAFTGAIRDYEGIFMQANGGTLFLDEIAEIPIDLQPKLLRVLDYGEVETIGDPVPRKVDIRLISATNKNIPELIQKGLFREDLYYRINNFQIFIPPLRQRKEDILELFSFYLDYYQKKYGKFLKIEDKLSIENLLLNYSWPGNVRELRNVCQNLVILNESGILNDRILREQLEFFDQNNKNDQSVIRQIRDEKEREIILEALKIHHFNIAKSAKYLGISRQHLYRKMKEYGIERQADR